MLNAYPTAPYFDEMIDPLGNPKPHYAKFYAMLKQFSADELMEKYRIAQLSFVRQGVTFTVYSEEGGAERTMPFDFIPHILQLEQWNTIEQGVIQRVAALNRFLEDVYRDQQIVKDGIIPRALIENNPYYYARQAGGMDVPIGNHIFLAGIDVIRDEHGEYRVLEDNLRNPSGMAYVYQNRYVMRQVFPEFFPEHSVRSLERQLSDLHQSLLDHVPLRALPGKRPRAVLLTPGTGNSAYYDHVFLAQQMGIELVEGSDLTVKDHVVYMKTISGLKRVDIIYRRIDDDYLDPLAFRPDSLLGVSGLLEAYRRGNVSILNGIGNGVADDKAIYAYVPEMIRYYLNEEPMIRNVDTYFMRDPEQRAYIMEDLSRWVVKNVSSSGGYDMLIGPHAGEEELETFRKKMIEQPHQYIAQPTIRLSRTPTFQEGRFLPCHIDLRVFVMRGRTAHVLPGGLTRVALKAGSLVVNSSQGGGSKDTWILEEGGR